MRTLGRAGRGARIVGLALCLAASDAWCQETQPRGAGAQQPPAPTEPAPILPSPAAPIAAYPLELLGLLAPPTQRGPVTLTPSIAVSEEYNDNVFSNNQNRQWDFITGFSPTITLFINGPSYQLNGGYSFGAQIYAREEHLSNAFDHHNFIANGLYKVAPELTLTASESFARDRNTNLVAPQGFSTSRQESWSNTFRPGMAWQMTPQDSLSLGATYSVLRFEGSGGGLNSDTYGFQSNLSHAFTTRFSGGVGYGFTYLDAQGQGSSTTHTPTVSLGYQLTRTLVATASGGPAVTEIKGQTFVSPAVSAALSQTLPFGSAGVQYARSVGVAGGFGGSTDTQSVSGILLLPTLQRGLLVAFSPAYSVAESLSSQQTGQVDVKTFTLSLQAAYQIARFTTIFGGYTFLHQRTGGSSSTQVDVDQNRVRFGLQFGYPFNFD